MNKILVIGILFLLSAFVSADLLPPDHSIFNYSCIKIVNIREFPEIVVLGYTISQEGKTEIKHIVNQDACLSIKKYPFKYYLLWVAKSFLDTAKTPDTWIEKFVEDLVDNKSVQNSPIHLLSDAIKPFGRTEWETYKKTIISAELFFKLYMKGPTVSLYLSKKITRFSDGTEATDTFPQPMAVISPKRKAVH